MKKKTKRLIVKRPTISERIGMLELTLNNIGQRVGTRATSTELRDLDFKIDRLLTSVAGVSLAQKQQSAEQAWPTIEQFNQMAHAVNKLAAYANAIATHKDEIIELTTKRIQTLGEQLALLRVRLRRLEEPVVMVKPEPTADGAIIDSQ
ncbi:MAG TPA: hypothetical protein VFB50_19905 [Chloroflexota bacterium]|nr:hypothetical protein [Chloroflexota bacterium]